MNKQNLWFLTLFSLILVLSIYYITMPSELLITNNSLLTETQKVSNNLNDSEIVADIYTSEILVALRVEADEKNEEIEKELTDKLTNTNSTLEEKNDAFEKLKELNMIKSKEEGLETKLKEQFKLESIITIDKDQVRIIIAGLKHDAALANDIMRSIQDEFDSKMYISVKFQK